MEELQLFESSVSATALTDIQEHVKLLPAVITTKKEFDTIYANYQNVRRLRIALDKDSKKQVAGYKATFTQLKGQIQSEENRILAILKPIESKLSACREVWEEKQQEIAEKNATEIAAEQEKEFNRQEIIRVYAAAWEDNAAFDQKIIDDIERTKKDEAQAKTEARLNQERLKFEQEKLDFERGKLRMNHNDAWDEAHVGKETKDQATNFLAGKAEVISQEEVTEIIKDVGDTINRIESNGDDQLKSVEVQLRYSLDVECPYCKKDYDLCDQDSDGIFSTPIFNNKWDDIKDFEIDCPHCDMVSTIKSVE